jgi:hypothetical protein
MTATIRVPCVDAEFLVRGSSVSQNFIDILTKRIRLMYYTLRVVHG